MPRFSRHIALLLLLLFCRAMVPDALLLELHRHTHTIHTTHTDSKKAQIGFKHKHCQVADVFGKPFQGSVATPLFLARPHTTHYILPHVGNAQSASLWLQHLRGPPQA